MGRYRLKDSTFFTNCIGNRYSSPFLISLAALDSFPPGEAMGAVSASAINSIFSSG